MTFDEWYDKVWDFRSMDPYDSAAAAWNAALIAAADKCHALADECSDSLHTGVANDCAAAVLLLKAD